MTNYERIKQMSVEEMASYFCIGGLPICPLHAPHCKDNKCPECFKKWLESEVDKKMTKHNPRRYVICGH